MTYPYALALLIAPGALLAFQPLCGSFAPDLRLAAGLCPLAPGDAAELVDRCGFRNLIRDVSAY